MSNSFLLLKTLLRVTLLTLLALLACVVGLVVVQSAGRAIHGDVITFVSRDNRDSNIYLFDLNLNISVEFLNLPEDQEWFSWSPDGKRLAFQSGALSENSTIYLLTVDTWNIVPLMPNSNLLYYSVAWSPDGQTIAVSGGDDPYDTDLYLIHVATGETLRRLHCWQRHYVVDWSSDGNSLLVTFFEGGIGFGNIILNLNESEPDCFLQVGSQTPSWNPDETKVAYASFLRDSQQHDLFIYDLNTGENRQLTNSPYTEAYPLWTGDEQYIVFTSNESGSSQIYIMDTDGNQRQQLTNNDRDHYNLGWMP